MGRVYGLKLMYDGAPRRPRRRLRRHADGLHDFPGAKPAIVAEVGTGICLPMDIVKTSVRGVFNVMKYKGMIEGKPEVEHDQYLLKDRPLLRPHNGGMFYPLAGPEMLNGSVPKGDAHRRDPQTCAPWKLSRPCTPPARKRCSSCCAALMTKVHPGDYAYILGDLTTAEHYGQRLIICHRSIARRGGSFPRPCGRGRNAPRGLFRENAHPPALKAGPRMRARGELDGQICPQAPFTDASRPVAGFDDRVRDDAHDRRPVETADQSRGLVGIAGEPAPHPRVGQVHPRAVLGLHQGHFYLGFWQFPVLQPPGVQHAI